MIKWLVAALVIWLAWRLLAKPRRTVPGAISDDREARRVLGVAPEADDDAIRAAHRKLVSEAHPDRGGSLDATRRINAARDLLLARR